jgi:hypothetical protein
MDAERELLCHFLAALAYRTQKALRGADTDFGDFSAGNQVRSPKELVRHMTSVLGYARTFINGGTYRPQPLKTLNSEVKRFHDILERLAEDLRSRKPFLGGVTEKTLLQGPLADAMTHAGQLAMLRRLYGSPVAPENFIKAEISTGNLSPNQPDPASPDSEWPEKL